MWKVLEQVFNWKKHPSGVLWLAVPPAAIGFILLMLRAILEIQVNDNYSFLFINLMGVVLFVAAVVPAYRAYIQLNKRNKPK